MISRRNPVGEDNRFRKIVAAPILLASPLSEERTGTGAVCIGSCHVEKMEPSCRSLVRVRVATFTVHIHDGTGCRIPETGRIGINARRSRYCLGHERVAGRPARTEHRTLRGVEADNRKKVVRLDCTVRCGAWGVITHRYAATHAAEIHGGQTIFLNDGWKRVRIHVFALSAYVLRVSHVCFADIVPCRKLVAGFVEMCSVRIVRRNPERGRIKDGRRRIGRRRSGTCTKGERTLFDGQGKRPVLENGWRSNRPCAAARFF